MVFFNVFIFRKKTLLTLGIGVRYCPLVNLLVLLTRNAVSSSHKITNNQHISIDPYPADNRRRRKGVNHAV